MSNLRSWLMLTGLSVLGLNACGEPGTEPSRDSAPEELAVRQQEIQNQALYNYIAGISSLILPTTSHTESSRSQEEVRDSTINMCTYTEVSETSHFDKLVSFDPNADVLWPGALVQGQSLALGLLSPIGTPRAPGTITLTNARIDGSSPTEFIYSRTLQSPSLASAQDAIQNILTAESINYAAKVAYTMHQAYSLNEGSVKAGISAQFAGATLNTTFGQSWTQSKTTFLVDFTQAYYTVSFNAPADPSAFFAPTATVADLSPFTFNGNPAGYLSSVTYGRRLLVKFESSEDSSKVSATLDATFTKGKAGGTITLDAEQQRVLRETKMTLLALGGPAGSAVEVIGTGLDKITSLQNYFQSGANFSPSSPGVPLSYTVRYLRNYQPLVVASTTSYTVPSCVGKTSTINVALGELYIHANGETFGKGEMNYDVYVNEELVVSGRNVKRGDNESISLGQSRVVTKLQKDANSLVVRAHVWENTKHVYPSITHSFSTYFKDWSPKGSSANTAEYKNLKVSLRYTATMY
ncbi:thiol-activated cytolysin family protein [Archangium lansingense]|uniref:Thiol-activated cytolysin family protein n=1 Tax=Archangium lansingense TaxID=2995310 RepID=A0ABT4AB52_9BACT|nr:thiol-activated cytolysin family protein [Archangium lansinium]MCY1078850.1 thiol-activated cytolysin family protein [Archangium lansinium]